LNYPFVVVFNTTMGSCHSSSQAPAEKEVSDAIQARPLQCEKIMTNSQLSVTSSSQLKESTCASSTLDTPTSTGGSLTLRNVDIWEEEALKDPRTQLSRVVLRNVKFEKVLRSREVLIENRHVFSHQLKPLPCPITDQKSSGRCWIFATTNVMRYGMMKKLDVVDFELSQVSNRYRSTLSSRKQYVQIRYHV
jgi:bleomycin hydrolase